MISRWIYVKAEPSMPPLAVMLLLTIDGVLRDRIIFAYREENNIPTEGVLWRNHLDEAGQQAAISEAQAIVIEKGSEWMKTLPEYPIPMLHNDNDPTLLFGGYADTPEQIARLDQAKADAEAAGITFKSDWLDKATNSTWVATNIQSKDGP